MNNNNELTIPENTKPCKYCGKPIPKFKFDSLGRKLTKTSDFCNNNRKCRNAYWRDQNRDLYRELMREAQARLRKARKEGKE